MSLIDAEIETLADAVGHALRGAGLMAATAESCTGGLVAGAITAIAGSSAWFDRGIVTYSDDAKRELLGVPREVLDAHGAVSDETARAMVDGVLRASRAGVAVSITGIAGPSGGSAEKPVGTVWIAWGRRGAVPESAKYRFPGDRAAVRRASVIAALERLMEAARGG
jgi:nicotinamide-nucleotide amidase